MRRPSESLLALGLPGAGDGNGGFDSWLGPVEAFSCFSTGRNSVSKLQAPKNKARLASTIGKRIVLISRQFDIDIPSVRSTGHKSYDIA
jgi:hypothetical protein